ncbi:MAG TPA: hypothetical protein VHG93_23545 [Longimicrobium sp.]|nr:hypothetical protein [Longimicrobium sp.]
MRPTAAACLLLLAIACTGGGEDRSGAPDSTAGAAAAPAPPPSRDAAAARDTAWTLRHDGIGPLRVGMTVEEARAALGGDFAAPGPDVGMPDDPEACQYARSGRFPAGVRVMLEGLRIARVEVDSGAIATAAGARIGDTEARINDLYPGRVTVWPHKYTDGHYLYVRPAEPSDTTRLIVFETDGRVVQRFRGGRKPQVEYVEGCA